MLTAYAENLDDLSFLIELGYNKILIEEPHFSLLTNQKYTREINYNYLEKAIKVGQQADIKVVLNIDIIFHNDDFKELNRVLPKIENMGYDCIRLQDIGLAYYISKHYPEMRIEINTVTGNYNHKSIDFLYNSFANNLDGIVFSKEASYKHLEHLNSHSQLKNEIQIHGPILMFYTKRRLIKGSKLELELMGGDDRYHLFLKEQKRPDEWFYFLDNQHGSFMFFCHELALIDELKKVMDTGISNYLLDLRGKSKETKKILTELYKKKLDCLLSSNNKPGEKFLTTLEPFYPNGLTSGFFLENKTDSHTKSKEKNEIKILGKVINIIKEQTIVLEVFESINVETEYHLQTPTGKLIPYHFHFMKLLSGEEIKIAREGQLIVCDWRKGIVPESYLISQGKYEKM